MQLSGTPPKGLGTREEKWSTEKGRLKTDQAATSAELNFAISRPED